MVIAEHYAGTVPIALHFPRAAEGSRPALDNLSAAWLADLATAGRSANTIRAYRADALAFLGWARGRGLEHWQGVDSSAVQAFLASEHARAVGLRLVARRAGTLRAVMSFAARIGHPLAVPDIATPQPSALAATVDPASVERVIRICRGEDFFAVRDRAALELLHGTGLTSHECCALDVDALDWPGALLTVEAGHRARRRVPLAARILEALRAWLSIRRTIASKGSTYALFTSAGGYRLSQDALSTLLARRSIAAGVVPVLTARVLRNSFGVRLFESGADESQVSALMGISFARAIDLRRATSPHKRTASEALRRLTEARQDNRV